MPHYLLAVHSGAPDPDAPPQPQPAPEQMQQMMARIESLEDELEASGAWVFSGRLTDADSATVVRRDGDRVLLTDGPYVESKEHMAGFYIIDADDLDGALAWADRVTECVGMPIEVRPFFMTGRARMPGAQDTGAA